MPTDRELLERATDWLNQAQNTINMAEVARRLEMNQSNLRKAINRDKNFKGTTVLIPERCLPAVQKLFTELRGAPRI